MLPAVRTLSQIAFAILLGSGLTARAEEKDSIEFQGVISAVDPANKTISVRRGTKDYVFKIDPERCKVVKDGVSSSTMPDAPAPTLESARVGDFVVGKFIVVGSAPIVTNLYLMTKPELGLRAQDKPGFIISPYPSDSAAGNPSGTKRPIDVRGYQRGSMLVDAATGQIFLVP